ncbi:MAG: hypothetical protein IRZ29_06960 [Thermoflavifilum sp.]|nr:hypothetical protein [Thermoflavifilum sp.]
MKNSPYIGIICTAGVIISVFTPWVYVAPAGGVLTAMDTGSTNLGKPGILFLFFGVWIAVNMWINRLWSKRVNLALGALLMAWMVRNYILFTHCEAGICPDKRWGLFLNVVACVGTFLAILFPPDDPQDVVADRKS